MNTHHLVFGLKPAPLPFADAPPLPRGGARKKTQQDPRAAMLVWALDRVRDDVPTASIKTVTMIFKAEYRTVTAVLNARSKFQTYQVIEATYKRANLAPPPKPEKSSADDKSAAQVPVGDDPQIHAVFEELMHMRQAMMNQTMLMDQLLKVLVNLPTNKEFVQLLESVKEQSAAHTSGLDALFQVMSAVHQYLDPEHRVSDPSAPTPLYSDKGQSPRARSRTPERMRDEDLKLDQHVSVPDSQSLVADVAVDQSQFEEVVVPSDAMKTEEGPASVQELSPCDPPVQCEEPVIIDQPRYAHLRQ